MSNPFQWSICLPYLSDSVFRFWTCPNFVGIDVVEPVERLPARREARVGRHRQAELREVLRREQQVVGHLEVLPDASEVAHVERDARDDLALHAD